MDAKKYDEQAQAEMLSYLKGKYGEEFVIAKYVPGGSGYTRDVWDQGYAHPTSDPTRTFIVRRFPEAEGPGRFDDGYVYLLAEDALLPSFTSVVTKAIPGSRVVLQLSSSTETCDCPYDGALDIDEFLQLEGGQGVIVHVFAPLDQATQGSEVAAVHGLGDVLAGAEGLTRMQPIHVAVYYFEDLPADPVTLPGRDLPSSEIARRLGAASRVATTIDDGVQIDTLDDIREQMITFE